jgi:hypothetical protein
MKHEPDKGRKCKCRQISTSRTSNGVDKESGNDCVREKKSRWLASAEGEEDAGAGEAEGEARGEEGLWVAAQERRGMRAGDEGEGWMHGTRQERDAVAPEFGCPPAPTRWRRVAR